MKIAARRMRKGSILPGYRGKEVVYAAGKGQLALYRGLESTGEAVVVTTAGQTARTRRAVGAAGRGLPAAGRLPDRHGGGRSDPDAGAGRGVVGMTGCAWSA